MSAPRYTLDSGTCPNHGGRWVTQPLGIGCQTEAVLSDVADERSRQFARYGTNESLEDGSGPETRWLLPYTSHSAIEVEGELRHDYECYEEETGSPTWVHLLREEFAEVVCETDPTKLREELIQLAALCVSWVEKIDEREAKKG